MPRSISENRCKYVKYALGLFCELEKAIIALLRQFVNTVCLLDLARRQNQLHKQDRCGHNSYVMRLSTSQSRKIPSAVDSHITGRLSRQEPPFLPPPPAKMNRERASCVDVCERCVPTATKKACEAARHCRSAKVVAIGWKGVALQVSLEEQEFVSMLVSYAMISEPKQKSSNIPTTTSKTEEFSA